MTTVEIDEMVKQIEHLDSASEIRAVGTPRTIQDLDNDEALQSLITSRV